MGVNIKLPNNVKNFIDQCLTDMIGTDVFGQNCILTMPPIPTDCTNCVADPIGLKSSNIYINGGPVPFENGQICPMCGGEYIIQQAVTVSIVMTLEYKYENFLDVLKKLVRIKQNSLQTRAYTSDIALIQNCISMEIKPDLGIARYKYKLAGEPIIAGKFTDKFCYAIWERI